MHKFFNIILYNIINSIIDSCSVIIFKHFIDSVLVISRPTLSICEHLISFFAFIILVWAGFFYCIEKVTFRFRKNRKSEIKIQNLFQKK